MDNKHDLNHNQAKEDQDYENALRKLRTVRNLTNEERVTILEKNTISDKEHIARVEHLAKKIQEIIEDPTPIQ